MDPLLLVRRFTGIAIGTLGIALLAVSFLSLQWKFQHDAALLFYISFLIEHFGYIPYKDIFDVNLPATYLIYAGIGRLTHYSNLGVRLADLTLLGGVMWMTWLWMKSFGRNVAWAGTIVFGLVYLRLGPAVSLQREFLILLPVLGGILAFTQLQRYGDGVRAAVAGLFFGIAALIKPHAALGFPVLLILESIERRSNLPSVLVRTLLPAVAGFTVPILAFLAYLIRREALAPFLSILENYYPLYSELTGEQSLLGEGERFGYLLKNYFQFGGFGWWWIPAFLGAYPFLRQSKNTAQNRQVRLMMILVLVYSLYPVFSGKFWHYHWLLFAYLSVQAGALCLVPAPDHTSLIRRLVPLGVFLGFAFFVATPTSLLLNQIQSGKTPALKGGRVEAIADFLRPKLNPGDAVQPLDWTGGAAHALLLAGARTATRFPYDVMFYHHVSGEYTQGLRRELVKQLELSQPRFIVEVFGVDKPWVQGEGTTRDFEDLRSFLQKRYEVSEEGNGYRIFERNNSAVPIR